METLKDRILEMGEALGFKEMKVIPALPLTRFQQDLTRRGEGDPDLQAAWSRRGMASDPMELMPTAKSLWVAVYPYVPYPEEFPRGLGTYSAHYRYYPEGRLKMESMGKLITEAGFQGMINPPLPMKAIAHMAGIGHFGKNSLLIHPSFGSYITLHLLLTDALFEYDSAAKTGDGLFSKCGACDRCIRACPTNAIGADGAVHLLKCLRHYMLSGEVVPLEIRECIGTRMLGCEICQRCCPKNPSCEETQTEGRDDLALFVLEETLKAHRSSMKSITERAAALVGGNYARSHRILSAAVIAAGNSGDPSYIPLLEELADHPNEPIRVHSAWALKKLQQH